MNTDLTSLRPGQLIHDVFALGPVKHLTAKSNGRPFLKVTLANASGAYETPVFGDEQRLFEGLAAGTAVEVRAKVGDPNPPYAPKLEFAEVLNRGEDHPVLKMFPQPRRSRDKARERFRELQARLSAPWNAFLDLVLADVGESYFQAPGAMQGHHAQEGGLLTHSMEVAEAALAMASAFGVGDRVDPSEIFVCAVLHDLGKCYENRYDRYPYARAEAGLLVGHMGLAQECVSRVFWGHREALSEAGFGEEQLRQVQHVIECHHGEVEWGSSVPPRTLAANLIFVSDLGSSRVEKLMETSSSGDEMGIPGWKTRGYNREVYAPFADA